MINLNNINYIDIGKRIKAERERNGLTREKFSELVSISPTYLSQIELGQRHPSLPTTIKIASTLHISLDFLVYGERALNVNKDDLIDIINHAHEKDLYVLKEILTAILPSVKY
ncbi:MULTISPECIES: helix-turn-helix domain-containing protein [Clostridium]|jgi:transcriptional regulator with XRE-family HTH domain|uniref:Transcriptional regulator n=4 Tax=Clostridium TaxID=1485 RepID=A0A0B5QQ66_CLOBE|nr:MULTISPECIES: helix-turn-helix transcriptional regulator [Clostridium]ABR34329.1 transcriptional regulator, XRE family [Clostridium beijerinckii NCIMB 8052]AIU02538.1 XRE family transcriptional regulator [Clostridium beijerinckii ATCC 35702]ALB46635.1 XRE family transcriptional regulator [Clostridium beijerinckii NRRL B-598]AVK51113.1 XRE family transcriptional regulator [Clostridium sp. MF28]POO89807.1 XRE family transcriptional regulator [Clostridium sp. 2-1]